MAVEHKVGIRLEGKDDASDDIKRVEGRFKRLSKTMKTAMVAGAIAVTAAFAGLYKIMKSVISAANEQENAVRKLDAALAPLGSRAAGVSKALQEQAAALQKVTRYGDETIIAGQALIASFTKNTEEIMGATKAALDLSAATGQSLTSAFMVLGRAASGETSMLSRYGITLDENIPKAEKFAAALVKINEQFGGQAAAQAETFSGLVDQVGNAYSDLQEQAGFAFTENEKITGSLKRLKEILEDEKTANSVAALAETLADLAVSAAEVATSLPQLADGAGVAADRFAEMRLQMEPDVVTVLRGAFVGFLKAIYDVNAAIPVYLGLLGEQKQAEEDLITATQRINEKLVEQWRALLTTGEGIESLAAAHAEATRKADLHADAEERLKRILEEERDAIEKTNDIAKKLGITFDKEIDTALRKNAEGLETVRQAWLDGTRSLEDYQKAVKATADADAKLRGELIDTAAASDVLAPSIAQVGVAADGTTVSVNELSDGTRRLTGESDRTTAATNRAAASFRAAAQSAIVYRSATGAAGGAGYVTQQTLRRQGEVNAAIAAGNQPIMGGTRIRLPGGGSRLVGTRRF